MDSEPEEEGEGTQSYDVFPALSGKAPPTGARAAARKQQVEQVEQVEQAQGWNCHANLCGKNKNHISVLLDVQLKPLFKTKQKIWEN